MVANHFVEVGAYLGNGELQKTELDEAVEKQQTTAERLHDRVHSANERVTALEDECSQLREVLAILNNDLEDLRHRAKETELEVENLTGQLERCKQPERRSDQDESPEIQDRRPRTSPVSIHIGVARKTTKTPTTTPPAPFPIQLQHLNTFTSDMLKT